MPAIAPKDEINTSANRHYFREPSRERVLVHSNHSWTPPPPPHFKGRGGVGPSKNCVTWGRGGLPKILLKRGHNPEKGGG